MKSAVIVFPGSNCDRDLAVALEQVTGRKPAMVWHRDSELPQGVDFIGIPGGFSYGDYLRSGAMAARSPIMAAVKDAAERGVPVIGICNGFQVLTEAGMLPGALQKNAGLTFVCDTVELEVVSTRSVLTNLARPGAVLRIPINHFEGNYVCDADTLRQLHDEDRIVVRYLRNPNGSLDDIAGISNEAGNVVGLMPHPERASEPLLGSADGVVLLRALLSSAAVVSSRG